MSSATSRPRVQLGHGSATVLRRMLQRLPRFLSTTVLFIVAFALMAALIGAAAGMRLRVEQSGSMAPTIHTGDLVVIKPVAVDTVAVGDVIGVRTSLGQVIVHRVTAITTNDGQLVVTTQGDANPTSEQWVIPHGKDVALVKRVLPALGGVVDRVQGPLAALAVLLAGLTLAAFQLRIIWRKT